MDVFQAWSGESIIIIIISISCVTCSTQSGDTNEEKLLSGHVASVYYHLL